MEVCRRGGLALEWLAQHASIDLLLIALDLRGGVSSQQEAQAALRAIPTAKLMFMRSAADAKDEAMTAFTTAWPVLIRPFSLRVLAEKVGGLLHPYS